MSLPPQNMELTLVVQEFQLQRLQNIQWLLTQSISKRCQTLIKLEITTCLKKFHLTIPQTTAGSQSSIKSMIWLNSFKKIIQAVSVIQSFLLLVLISLTGLTLIQETQRLLLILLRILNHTSVQLADTFIFHHQMLTVTSREKLHLLKFHGGMITTDILLVDLPQKSDQLISWTP